MRSKLHDPMLHDVELPLAATYYPLGFRLTVLTNSPDVHAAVAESWGRYEPVFDRPPLVIRVIVRSAGDRSPQPVTVTQEHLFSVIADRDNFACADSKTLLAYSFVAAKTASDYARFRWFFLEPMVYYLLTQWYTMPMHAACVAKEGRGILLSGASGAGKSTLAFACARAGWTFLADDATSLLQASEDRLAIGMPHQARLRDDAARLFPELQGFCTSARPNGKRSIEIQIDKFPQIRTALQCRIEAIVFLNRGSGTPGLQHLPTEDAVETLLSGMPSYGPEVRARHQHTMSRLLEVPAYRLCYQCLQEAMKLLEALSHRQAKEN